MTTRIRKKKFFLSDGVTLAKELLGKSLHSCANGEHTSGIIVETEAYIGPLDPASHAYQNKHTTRTAIQFEVGGFVYVYRIYGIHTCFCIVAGSYGEPEVVLIRALEPISGADIMIQRRGLLPSAKKTLLTSGPGRLTQAMDITMNLYGLDLVGSEEVYLSQHRHIPESRIRTSPRINIDYAGNAAEWPWRFYIKDNPFVT